MTKAVVGRLVADKHKMPRGEAEKIVETVLESIVNVLANNGEIQFANFGRFYIEHRGERAGRNPHTGEALVIPARRQVKFKPGDNLKKVINGSQ